MFEKIKIILIFIALLFTVLIMSIDDFGILPDNVIMSGVQRLDFRSIK